jgi:ATP-binding cassette, subfamily B, bacterial CvaB/MchF/RaxB
MNHYVVLERIKGNKLVIHNPGRHSAWMSFQHVSDHFTGVALELRPANNFEVSRQRGQLHLSKLWHRMTGIGSALVQILLLTLVLQAFVLASPYYMQITIDNVLPARDTNLLTVLALGFALFTLINVGATVLRSFVLLVASTTVSFGLSSNIPRHLFRLPITWFEKRHVGDIISRFQFVGPIQNILTTGAVAALVDGSMAILTLVLMLWYN